MKRGFIATIILSALAISIAVMVYFSSRTIWNKENATGNLAGNLSNGGYFCEDGDTIYFSNPNDDGSLYSMDSNCADYKKVHSDKVSYINVTPYYIVYVRDNHARSKAAGSFFNFYNVGVYRIDKKNPDNIKLLYHDPAAVTGLCGNYVYYQHYNTTDLLQFYRVKLDAKETELLSEEPIEPASYVNGTLYYNGVKKEHNIHAMNLSTGQVTTVAEGNYFSILAQGNYIYYLDLAQNYNIGRMGLDGSNPELLVHERCSFLNVTPDDQFLFYQVDGGDHNRLCKLNLSTMEETTLLDGDFCNLNLTSQYLFFMDFHTEQWYRYTLATGSREPFNPPVLLQKN